MDDHVYNFFVDDTRKNAPLDSVLPPWEDIIQSQLWNEILVECCHDHYRFVSGKDDTLAYWLTVKDIEEWHQRLHQFNEDIAYRIKQLTVGGCIRRAVWKVHSTPRIDLMDLDLCRWCFQCLLTVDSVEIYVSPHVGILPLFIVPKHGHARNVVLNILKGDFSSSGSAFRILKPLQMIGSNFYSFYVKVHLEISKITPAGRKELEKASKTVRSITIEEVREYSMLERIMLLVRNTKIFEVNINRIAIPGNVEIVLPRGDISLSIASVSSKCNIDLCCAEELVCLTATKEALGRIIGPDLLVERLRVMGTIDTSAFRHLCSQFGRVFEKDEVLMTPRLGLIHGHGVWSISHRVKMDNMDGRIKHRYITKSMAKGTELWKKTRIIFGRSGITFRSEVDGSLVDYVPFVPREEAEIDYRYVVNNFQRLVESKLVSAIVWEFDALPQIDVGDSDRTLMRLFLQSGMERLEMKFTMNTVDYVTGLLKASPRVIHLGHLLSNGPHASFVNEVLVHLRKRGRFRFSHSPSLDELG